MSFRIFWLIVLVIALVGAGVAQGAQPPVATGAEDASTRDLLRQLQQQVSELRSAVEEMREETQRSREEAAALRQELRLALERHESPAAGRVNASNEVAAQSVMVDNPTPVAEVSASDRLTRLEEQFQVLSGQTSDQYQTKVESSSRYRVRLNGIALFNVASTRGGVDDIDTPTLAYGTPAGLSGGSFAATLRQSQIGFEVFGPQIAGAKTRGNVQFDFAGGFPPTAQGVTMGIMRLRTATVRLDWEHTSIVAGQDAPFISSLSPTSVATLATPALSYAGNLWTWVPQLRIEHRRAIGERSNVLFQAGILDSLTGQAPRYTFRLPQAGEASRQPAYAGRIAWTQEILGHPVTLGAGGYYGRQDWNFGRHVDGWAATADWSIPLGRGFSVTGEFFRGRAIGGLSGGLDHSVVSSGPTYDSSSQIAGLDTIGGWTQLKYKPLPKLEFNAAAGEDSPFAGEVRRFPYSPDSFYGSYLRNQSALFNVIYRPRSNLLFSAEYRHIRSFELESTSHSADHVNLVMGILF